VKLHLTKKEYRALVDLLQVADWILHSHSVKPEEFSSAHEAVMKKILSFSEEMQCEDIIEHDKSRDEYYETPEYEAFLQEKFIEPYNAQTFWEELADRLATRDALREIGEEKFQSMEPMERVIFLGEKTDAYENEFEEHGLECLTIIRNNLTTN
jgi:hypothetical protein